MGEGSLLPVHARGRISETGIKFRHFSRLRELFWQTERWKSGGRALSGTSSSIYVE